MSRDPKVTSRMMAQVRAKNTKPEMAVRRRLWKAGYRYRVHYKAAPGRPDIAFPRLKLAIFVDGDFWHGNAWKVRGLSKLEDMFPTRTEWWTAKIRRNIERDREVDTALRAEGWRILRIWESEVKKEPEAVIAEIGQAIETRRGEMISNGD